MPRRNEGELIASAKERSRSVLHLLDAVLNRTWRKADLNPVELRLLDIVDVDLRDCVTTLEQLADPTGVRAQAGASIFAEHIAASDAAIASLMLPQSMLNDRPAPPETLEAVIKKALARHRMAIDDVDEVADHGGATQAVAFADALRAVLNHEMARQIRERKT